MTDSPRIREIDLPRGFRLGEWRVEPELGRISDSRGEHHVAPKAMDLLVFLAENAGQVKSKDEILDVVWRHEIVADGAVFRHVSALRSLLGDDRSQPRFIETIPKRGYRLIAPVHPDNGSRAVGSDSSRPDNASAVESHEASGRARRRRLAWLVAGIGALATLVWILWPHRAAEPDDAKPKTPDQERAYQLYLQGHGTSRDPDPNLRAIELLRTSVRLDPEAAAAWASLAERLYLHGSYGGGGESEKHEALQAAQKAFELDASSEHALSQLVILYAELGDLGTAHRLVTDFLDRHPGSGEGHFALAYVYRYAGLLPEAARECEAAFAIDPGNLRLRSCAIVFYRLGDFDRAEQILRSDTGAEWVLLQRGLVALHRGQPDATLDLWRKLTQEPWVADYYWAGVLAMCLDSPDAPGADARLRKSTEGFRQHSDPEGAYIGALLMNACGRGDLALDLLEDAATRGYCAVSAFESEPVFAELRAEDRFDSARLAAVHCRDAFLDQIRADGQADGRSGT